MFRPLPCQPRSSATSWTAIPILLLAAACLLAPRPGHANPAAPPVRPPESAPGPAPGPATKTTPKAAPGTTVAPPPDAPDGQDSGQQGGQDIHQTNNAAAARLLHKADTIAAKVAKLRGLAQKRPIQRGVMQKDGIRARLVERIGDEYTNDEIAAEALALKRFRMLPETMDYKQVVIELLTDQIAGFYDPIERQLYIAGWQQGGFGAMGDDMIMAHEIDHALQDQHFDLRAFIKPIKKNGDASVARQALIEGDGTALMVEYMLNDMGVQFSPWQNDAVLDMLRPQMTASMATGKLAEAPLILRESLIFPYLGGLEFIAHFRRRHPWKRIDAMYRKPPLSTEHILHPDKYEDYERPVRIAVAPVAALAGFELVYENVHGEAGMDVLLRQHMIEAAKPAPGAGKARRNPDHAPGRDPAKTDEAIRHKIEQAAAGWGGDRMAVFAPAGHGGGVAGTVGISYSVWDQPADAIEFFDLLSDAMPSLSGGSRSAASDSRIEYRDPAGAVYLAERKGNAVVMVLGALPAQAPALLGQVWKRWRVQRP